MELAPTGTKPQVEELQTMIEDPAEEQPLSSDALANTVNQMRLIWSKRGLLGKAFGLGLVAGVLIALLIPSRYDSTVQLMPPDNQSGSGAMMMAALTARSAASSALGGMASDLLGIKSSGALFVGVLGSRTVQDRLVQRFDLKKVYSARLDEDARKKLASRTFVVEDRKSGIISITVTDRDPNRAAGLAGAYVDELNQLTAELSTSGAHRERVFLEGRLAAVKKDLDDASVKFSQFASKNAALDIKEQGRAMVEAASRLEGEKIAAESELRGLEQIYTPSNIRVRAVQARIGELQAQLEKMGGKPGTDEQPIARASARTGQNDSTSTALYPSIRELPVLGVTWSDLYRNNKIQETVYEVLTQQYELAKVQEAKETPSVKVLDGARIPERKSFPPRTLITVAIAFSFMAAAALWVSLRTQWDEADSNNPGKLFAQEVLQSVSQYLPWVSNRSSAMETTEQKWDRKGRARALGQDSKPGAM
jgi:capsule polysaccharide export protein KpsE/RkpR